MTPLSSRMEEVPCQGYSLAGLRPTTIISPPEAALFVAILAPDESWSVFDCRSDHPAETAGRCLLGLSREEAATTARRRSDSLRRFGDWEVVR